MSGTDFNTLDDKTKEKVIAAMREVESAHVPDDDMDGDPAINAAAIAGSKWLARKRAVSTGVGVGGGVVGGSLAGGGGGGGGMRSFGLGESSRSVPLGPARLALSKSKMKGMSLLQLELKAQHVGQALISQSEEMAYTMQEHQDVMAELQERRKVSKRMKLYISKLITEDQGGVTPKGGDNGEERGG